MITLEQFKANAQSHGICEMLDDWNKCKSKKQLIDLALSVRGMQYLADAIAQGWGCDAEYIESEFAPFLNGRYIRQADGYSSALYCKNVGEVKITTTCALIVDCRGIIRVDRPCELYIVNSDVIIVGDGIPQVYSYNSNIEHPNTPITVKENKNYAQD